MFSLKFKISVLLAMIGATILTAVVDHAKQQQLSCTTCVVESDLLPLNHRSKVAQQPKTNHQKVMTHLGSNFSVSLKMLDLIEIIHQK